MQKKLIPMVAAALGATLLPTLALAHPLAGVPADFAHGFAHPLSGLDHVMAMTLVGLLAAARGGRAILIMPASFLILMVIGAGTASLSLPMPMVELLIALSVFCFGLALTVDRHPALWIDAALVGFFALFHGHAHAIEMPGQASSLAFGGGFLLATALLHGLGLALGLAVSRLPMARRMLLLRSAGGLAALAGVGLATGLL